MAITKTFNGAPITIPGAGYSTASTSPGYHHYHVLNSALRNYDVRSVCAYQFMLDLLVRLSIID